MSRVRNTIDLDRRSRQRRRLRKFRSGSVPGDFHGCPTVYRGSTGFSDVRRRNNVGRGRCTRDLGYRRRSSRPGRSSTINRSGLVSCEAEIQPEDSKIEYDSRDSRLCFRDTELLQADDRRRGSCVVPWNRTAAEHPSRRRRAGPALHAIGNIRKFTGCFDYDSGRIIQCPKPNGGNGGVRDGGGPEASRTLAGTSLP